MSQDETKRRDIQVAMTKYLESHRGRPAIKPPPRMDLHVSRLIRPMARKFGPGVSVLDEHWSRIVGAKLAGLCRPEKFIGGKVLVLKARGPAAAMVSAQTRQIVERINRVVGDDTVRALRVIQGPIARKAKSTSQSATKSSAGLSPTEETKLKSTLTDFKDGPLKNALEDLGRGVLRHDRK